MDTLPTCDRQKPLIILCCIEVVLLLPALPAILHCKHIMSNCIADRHGMPALRTSPIQRINELIPRHLGGTSAPLIARLLDLGPDRWHLSTCCSKLSTIPMSPWQGSTSWNTTASVSPGKKASRRARIPAVTSAFFASYSAGPIPCNGNPDHGE
jgi:hypothetical protein